MKKKFLPVITAGFIVLSLFACVKGQGQSAGAVINEGIPAAVISVDAGLVKTPVSLTSAAKQEDAAHFYIRRNTNGTDNGFQTLIDFSLFEAGMDKDESGNFTQNQATLMEINGERKSLALTQWAVFESPYAPIFSNAARNMERNRNSDKNFVRAVTSKEYGTVFGARTSFTFNPQYYHFLPPFTIPLDDARFENGYGLIKNGKKIKDIIVTAHGLDFDNGLYLSLLDDNNEFVNFYFGSLNFYGWREISLHPDLDHHKNSNSLLQYNLSSENIRFGRFSTGGGEGDFAVYIKDVKIIYE